MAFVPSVPVASRSPFAASSVTSSTSSNNTLPVTARRNQASSIVRMAAASDADVPDMAKRNTMNLLLGGAVGTAAAGMLYPFAFFFVPKGSGGAGGGTVAKDALGNAVKKDEYLASHATSSRELVQGLRGDATWLIVNDLNGEEKDLEYFALNAVCTHLGCVVPWVPAEKKYKCPCHGSQYSPTGAVIRGPAPLPLALEHVETDDSGNVILKSWKETDFRTGENPWWNF